MTHREAQNDIKTGVSLLPWDEHGRYLLTGQAVPGVEGA
jgi:hypothetical protein